MIAILSKTVLSIYIILLLLLLESIIEDIYFNLYKLFINIIFFIIIYKKSHIELLKISILTISCAYID